MKRILLLRTTVSVLREYGGTDSGDCTSQRCHILGSPSWGDTEICDLVECSVQQWNTSQHGTQVADLFQTFTGKSRGEPSQAMIDLFLYESVAAI